MGHGDLKWTARAKGKTSGGVRHPTGSDEAVDDYIAHEAGVIGEVTDQRDWLFAKAQRYWAKHNKAGGSKLEKDSGVTDRYIVLNDQADELAANAIEARLHVLQYVLMQ